MGGVTVRVGGVRGWAAGAAVAMPAAAWAAAAIDGAQLGLAWAVPFVGMLLSIALLPLLALRLWHHHYGKIAAGWALASLLPLAAAHGAAAALDLALHTLLL